MWPESEVEADVMDTIAKCLLRICDQRGVGLVAATPNAGVAAPPNDGVAAPQIAFVAAPPIAGVGVRRSSDAGDLRMNEALMKLLLKLDSVPGVDPAVREARRVSRRIVGLQEILDAIVQVDVDGFWGCGGGFGRDYWNDVVAEMEEGVCRERGGEEMERFCAEHLGFRCLQRFLSQP
ncbi:hypothetical protein ACLB2K_027648 [Fragaria x ananassa]